MPDVTANAAPPYLPEGAFRTDAGALVCDLVSLLPTSDGAGAFELQPWQREALTEFYGTMTCDEAGAQIRQYQYLYLELPKKNGKSELAAALGLHHLMWDGEVNGEVYVVAADKDNAGIVFNAAVYMIRSTPALARLEKAGVIKIVESQRLIHHKKSGSRMKVLSSEAYSKHGYKPSCVIFDELHAQPNRDLWDVMTFGSGSARRQPVWIVLTTAGDDPDRGSIGWEVHERALNYLRARGKAPCPLEEDGTPRRYEDDPTWLPIMYGVSALTGDDEDAIAALDIYDEKLWHLCNPSLGKTVKLRALRQEAMRARQSEAAERLFRWLRLNQWISTKTVGWMPLTIYDKTQWNRPEWKLLPAMERRGAVRAALRGKKCYGGLDLSKSTDLTAFVLLFPPQEGLETWVALFWAWRPEDGLAEAEKRDHVPYRDWERAGFLEICEGDIVDYSRVEETIWEASEQFRIEALGLDPAMAWTLSSRLMTATEEHQALEVITIPQTMKEMSPAMKKLETLIRAHEMLHEHNTCARWCFGNVRCAVDGNENMKPMKNRSIGRIDIAVAWIIAMATAMLKQSGPPDLAEVIAAGRFSM